MGLIDGVEFQEPKGSFLYPLAITQLSAGLHCLHGWYQDWGPGQWRYAAQCYKFQEAQHKADSRYTMKPPTPTQFTVEWARKRIEEGLAKVGRGLVIAVFPTFPPYNKNAALLREYGFGLLGNRCYPNPNYAIGAASTLPKGSIYSSDGYPHWLHVWAKDLKGLEECGLSQFGQVQVAPIAPGVPAPVQVPAVRKFEVVGFPNCCGMKVRWSTADLKGDPYQPLMDQNKFLALCQIPADQKFPKGWKRFANYRDFKWGINFEAPQVRGVQACPHEFDLARIEAYEMAQPLPKLG